MSASYKTVYIFDNNKIKKLITVKVSTIYDKRYHTFLKVHN